MRRVEILVWKYKSCIRAPSPHSRRTTMTDVAIWQESRAAWANQKTASQTVIVIGRLHRNTTYSCTFYYSRVASTNRYLIIVHKFSQQCIILVKLYITGVSKEAFHTGKGNYLWIDHRKGSYKIVNKWKITLHKYPFAGYGWSQHIPPGKSFIWRGKCPDQKTLPTRKKGEN